jgi:hypothetical protein
MSQMGSFATDANQHPIRNRLYNLTRYCSARGIGPSAVDDKIFDDYWRYRTETTARASNNTARRFMVRAWNACAAELNGWPLQRLTEPDLKILAEPAWNAFPDGLRTGVDEYFAGLAKPHRSLRIIVGLFLWELLQAA